MNRASSERAVVTTALVVAIIYAYRRLEEPSEAGVTVPRLMGVGEPVSFAAWATAWGTVFFMLSIASDLAPSVAGAFAVLVGVSDVLTNGKQLFSDLGAQTNPDQSQSTNTQASEPNNQ